MEESSLLKKLKNYLIGIELIIYLIGIIVLAEVIGAILIFAAFIFIISIINY